MSTSTSLAAAADRRAPGRECRYSPQRFPRADGPIRIGQDRRSISSAGSIGRRRVDRRGGPAAERPGRRGAVAMAVAKHRVRLPALQPPAGAHRRAERRAATPADLSKADRRGRVGIALKVVGLSDRTRATTRASSRADKNSGSASRGPSSRPDPAAVRRAPRPGPQVGRRNPQPAAGAEPRSRQDNRDGQRDPHAAERARRTLHLKGTLMEEAARPPPLKQRRPGRVPPSHLEERLAPEVPHDLHPARDVRRVLSVRHPDDDPDSVHVRRGHRRGRSPRADSQGQPHHAAPDLATASSTPGGIATHNSWIRRGLPGSSNFFAQIVVEPEPFMTIYKEYVLPPEQMKAWLNDRQGAIVGRDLAERFGWEIGDRIPITGTIFQPKPAARPGNSTSPASTTAATRSTRRSSSSSTTTWTRTARSGGDRSLVHREDRRRVAGDRARRQVRRDVRELGGGNEDDH